MGEHDLERLEGRQSDPISAVDEIQRETRENQLRAALTAIDINVPSSFGLKRLGYVFADAGLDPKNYLSTSRLTDPKKDALRDVAEELEKAVGRHSDRPDNGTPTEEEKPWEAINKLYLSSHPKRARQKAAKQVVEDLWLATRRQTGHIYVWDPDEQVYAEDGEEVIEETLVRRLGSNHSRREVREVEEKVRALTYRENLGEESAIPVANGDLRVPSWELMEATPERAFLVRSPACWRLKAEAPLFRTFLKKAVPSEQERRTLQEYTGYGLMHWQLPLHKALFIVGPKASGKSTFLHVVQRLYGRVCHLAPHQLVNGRFGASELEGAWANVRADISAALLKDIGLFKEIVAGDPIYVERKYEQGYTLQPTTKHLYSANRLPDVSIDDDAFFRRILIVSFPNTVPRDDRDPKLPDRLDNEIDGILRWAVQGLCRVLDEQGFTNDRAPRETRRRWEEHSSSVGRFKATALNVTGDAGDVEAKQDVYTAYAAYCEEHGLSTETQQGLTRTLKRDPRIEDGQRTPPGYSSQTRCYVGLELRTDAVKPAND